MIELYDSDIIEIEKVYLKIQERAESRREFAVFDREIRERFWEAGYRVDVKWYEAADGQTGMPLPEVQIPEIEIIGRVNEGEAFDHDRLRHEIVGDMLDIGQGGVIKVGPEDELAKKQYEQAHKGHEH